MTIHIYTESEEGKGERGRKGTGERGREEEREAGIG